MSHCPVALCRVPTFPATFYRTPTLPPPPQANSVGWLDPGYNNFAVWRGLQHNTLYHYFVGSAESGFSAVRNFTTPPLARSDCYKVPFTGQPCDGYHCSKECLKHVDTVKLLLAADVGTNNHRDGTWSADGQGFFAINSAQVRRIR